MTGESVAGSVDGFAAVSVAMIDPSPFQHRRTFDASALRELARSIETDGLVQPITVRKVGERHELIAGERRWRAVSQFTEQTSIVARVLDVDDNQARRLCAVENLQRADLTAIEEIGSLVDLIDVDLSLSFGDEYSALSKIQEPKWRVKALLTLIESDRKHGTEKVGNKFVAKTDAIFAGLPKTKEMVSFAMHDLPLIFTPDEVQRFAMEHKLNKSQTKAVAEIAKAEPAVFKAIVNSKTEDSGNAFTDLVLDRANDDADSESIKKSRVAIAKKDIEEVRDLSAETIKKAAKQIRQAQRQATARAIDFAPVTQPAPAQEEIKTNPFQVGDWWQLGRHRLYCGDTSQPDFHAHVPEAEFAFADPPYGVNADEWDGAFYWDHDWLIKKAPIVAVTPGQPAIMEFARKTTMPYRNSMASWITNGMTLSEFGYQNWIYLAFFARDGVKLFRQCQDVIRCTIDISTTAESGHRGRKPAEMMTAILDLYCKDQKTVIDPFLGSGTTLLVAEKTGRTCYGGELSPEYCWAILRRWESLTGERGVKQ